MFELACSWVLVLLALPWVVWRFAASDPRWLAQMFKTAFLIILKMISEAK